MGQFLLGCLGVDKKLLKEVALFSEVFFEEFFELPSYYNEPRVNILTFTLVPMF